MKNKWMKRGIAIMLLACMTLVPGCGNSNADAEKAKKPSEETDAVETITVGRPGLDIKIACIILASELGYYQEEGVDVRFETISTLADGMTAVSQGKLDGRYIP